MELFTPIITIATFALYTFIFSLFIVPLLKELRDIRARLRGLIRPKSFFKKEGSDNERKKQRKQITDILKDYKLRRQEVTQSTRFLIGGVLATGFAAFLLLFITIPSGENILLHVFYNKELLIFVIYIVAILCLMSVAFLTNVPSPSRMTDWEYLVKNFGLSPSGLAECANLRVNFNPRDRSIFERHDPKEKRPIQILSDIELRGYKYWFFVYDPKDKAVVFNLTGTVNKRTDLNERFFDVDDFYEWSTTVGEFDAFRFRDKKLQMFFFVFDPILYGDVGGPYWGYNEFTYDGTITFSSAHNVPLKRETYSKIKYFGRGLKLKELKWDTQEIALSEEDIKKINSTQYWDIVENAFKESREELLKR